MTDRNKPTHRNQPCKRVCLHLRTANTLTVFMLALLTVANAQNKINYDIFNKPFLGQLKIMLPSPQPFQFKPVDINTYSPQVNKSSQFGTNPFTNSIQERNNNIIAEDLRQYNLKEETEKQQYTSIKNDLMEMPSYRAEMDWRAKATNYINAFNEFNKINPDSFSLSKAIFLVENAYLNNQLKYDKFKDGITVRANFVKQLLKREGLSTKSSVALNYGIQKLFSKKNLYTNPKTKQSYLVPPLKYDFEDFMGEKDYTKMFVSKAMVSGKGQCHSMPLLYLLIAEQLGANAQLSLAPQHSFIQFKDKEGKAMNFETTNGNLVSNTWLTQSGYITSMALQNKTYINPLSQKQIYAQMLGDLLLGYLAKMPYDDFAEKIRQKVLAVNPNNITALIVDANMKTELAKQKIKEAGKPKEEDLPKYPEAYKAYQAMQAAYDKVEATGYQDMPKEAYSKWLKSIEQEKKKQSNKALQEKMQREIQQLKNIKTTFQNNIKG
jgi:hypothetical protein